MTGDVAALQAADVLRVADAVQVAGAPLVADAVRSAGAPLAADAVRSAGAPLVAGAPLAAGAVQAVGVPLVVAAVPPGPGLPTAGGSTAWKATLGVLARFRHSASSMNSACER